MYRKLFTLLLLFGISANCAFAQSELTTAERAKNAPLKYRVSLFDKEKQQWTTETMVACTQHNRVAIQDSVTFLDMNGKYRTFTPKDAKQFFVDKDAYFSLSFKYNGQQKNAFLMRERYDKTDDITFFIYYISNNKLMYYFRQGDDGEVLPASDDARTGYVSPLHDLLRQKAGGDADKYEGYYDVYNMTSKKYIEARKTITSGTINSISRFRWGVTANAGIYAPNIPDYEFDSKAGFAAGLFANIPIFLGFSVNVEATLSKYAYKGSMLNAANQNQVVYNSTEISTPLMLRYTFKYIKGKVVPYVQVGYQPSFALSNKLEYIYKTSEKKYENDWDYGQCTVIRQGEADDVKKSNSAVIGSAGAEIIINNNHRLYLDVRGAFSPSEFGRSGIMVSASYNL